VWRPESWVPKRETSQKPMVPGRGLCWTGGHHSQIESVINSPKGRLCQLENSRLESSQIESVPLHHRSPLLKCHGCWEVPTPSQFAWWQLKSPHMRKRELGYVVKGLSMLSEREMQMGMSLLGEWYNTQPNKRWEWRGSHCQRYSWGLGGVMSVYGQWEIM